VADSAIVETLLIKIGTDIVDLKKGMTDVNTELGKVEKNTRSTAAAVGNSFNNMVKSILPTVTVLGAVKFAYDAFTSAISQAGEVNRLSQQTGIAVDKLSALKFALEASGVSFEQFSSIVRSFSSKMSDALTNVTSDTALALRQLDINARTAEGGLKTIADIIPEVARKFVQMEDGVAKAQIAMALFGERVGLVLLPFLNKGEAGIKELMQKAKDLGLVFDTVSVQSAKDFKLAMVQLNLATTELGMALLQIAQQTGLIQLIKDLAAALQSMRTPVSGSADELNVLAKRLQDVQIRNNALIQTMREVGEATGVEGILKRFFFGTGAGAADFEAKIAEETELMLRFLELMKKVKEPPAPAGESGAGSTGGKGRFKDLAIMKEEVERAQFAYDTFMERVLGSRTILDDMSTSWSTYADRVVQAQEKINAVGLKGFQQEKAFADIKKRLQQKEQDDILGTAEVAASTLTSVFAKNKNAAIGAAIIHTAVGITRALSSVDPPWSFVQAALIAAAGVAQIASIRGATESGGGGTAPTASAGGGGASTASTEAPSRSIMIQGIDPAAIFSGRQMESLIDALNSETSRGKTLIATQLRPT